MSEEVRRSIIQRIERATHSVRSARIHLDLFDFLERQDNLDDHEDAFIPYWDLFRFSKVAHEWAFCVRICNLLVYDRKTNNLRGLVADTTRCGIITHQDAKEINRIIRPHLETINSMNLIRNKAVAHQDEDRTQTEVYSSASLTLDAMIQLSNASLMVTNRLRQARGLPSSEFLTSPLRELRQMLNDLRRAPRDMDSFFKYSPNRTRKPRRSC